jgi:hypothetical protein
MNVSFASGERRLGKYVVFSAKCFIRSSQPLVTTKDLNRFYFFVADRLPCALRKTPPNFSMASKTHPGALSVTFAAALNLFSGLIESSVADCRRVRFSIVGKRDFLHEISMPGRGPATTFRDV